MDRRDFIKSLGVAAVGLYLYQGNIPKANARPLTRDEQLLLKYAPYQFELVGTGVPFEKIEAELKLSSDQSRLHPTTVTVIDGDPTVDKPVITATVYSAGCCTITGWKLLQREGKQIGGGTVMPISLATGDSITITYAVNSCTE